MAPLVATLPMASPPRPYRRFLTSALHRRFVHAATFSLLIALNNAFWLGSKKDLFWSWFPFGPAGLKALLFFICNLLIFILQIATLQVGRKTATSPWSTARSSFLGFTALQTMIFYLASAFWFSEVYIWSSPDLYWVTKGTHNTPDVLNERPIFFRVYALILAVVYAGVHLWRGNSCLRILISKLPATPSAETRTQETHQLEPVHIQLQRKLIPALVQSGAIAGITIIVAPFVNGLFLRNIFWQLHLALAKPFYNLSRANAHPIGYPPLGPVYLLRCLCAGFLLVVTWEFTTVLFMTYLKQAPTKATQPLSATSKDPNGTLLTGLKAKRDVVRAFAFWELVIIAQKHRERRQAIFEDIEQPTGPVWSQMVQAGLTIMQEIQLRISGPPPTKPAEPEKAKELPRLLPQSQTQSIFAAQRGPSTKAEWLASPLKAFGSTKQPWHPPIEQTAKQVEAKLLEYAKPPGTEQTSSGGLFDQWVTALKQSRLGWIFTQTNTAKINATVLGSPFGNAALFVDVIEALTKMQVASLTEDTYGKATPTVPNTVRTFTKTLNLIEGYVTQNKQGVAGGIVEVEIIIEKLRASLKELLSAFQVYLVDQGLGISELNQAKKAIQPPSQPSENREKPQPRSLEQQQSQKQLSQNDRQKERPREQQDRRREKEPLRIEEPTSWTLPRNTASGPLFQRREMEQVR